MSWRRAFRTGGVNYGPIEAQLEREQGDNVWITLSIREGKNREVRRIMEHLGLTVNRLIRVSFGPFILGDLEPGQIEEVKTSVLKDQLGPRLARQLGVKREPLREDRKLAPGRSKPTYLRRKPSPAAAPERPAEERPMKRRRIFQEDGGEAPKVELVPEKRRRPRPPTAAAKRPENLSSEPGGSARNARSANIRPAAMARSAGSGGPVPQPRVFRKSRAGRIAPNARSANIRPAAMAGNAGSGGPVPQPKVFRKIADARIGPNARSANIRPAAIAGSAGSGGPVPQPRAFRKVAHGRIGPNARSANIHPAAIAGNAGPGKPGSASEGRREIARASAAGARSRSAKLAPGLRPAAAKNSERPQRQERGERTRRTPIIHGAGPSALGTAYGAIRGAPALPVPSRRKQRGTAAFRL